MADEEQAVTAAGVEQCCLEDGTLGEVDGGVQLVGGRLDGALHVGRSGEVVFLEGVEPVGVGRADDNLVVGAGGAQHIVVLDQCLKRLLEARAVDSFCGAQDDGLVEVGGLGQLLLEEELLYGRWLDGTCDGLLRDVDGGGLCAGHFCQCPHCFQLHDIVHLEHDVLVAE